MPVLLALLAVLLLCIPVPLAAQDAQLPDDITRYVEARNFAAAFSLPAERAELVRYHAPEQVKEATGSHRLARVFVCMRLIDGMEYDVDDGMRVPFHPAPPPPIAPETIHIDRVTRPDENRLLMEVTAHRLHREANLQYVRQFEELEGTPDLESDVITESYRKVYEWRMVGGRWMRNAAHVRTLEG